MIKFVLIALIAGACAAPAEDAPPVETTPATAAAAGERVYIVTNSVKEFLPTEVTAKVTADGYILLKGRHIKINDEGKAYGSFGMQWKYPLFEHVPDIDGDTIQCEYIQSKKKANKKYLKFTGSRKTTTKDYVERDIPIIVSTGDPHAL